MKKILLFAFSSLSLIASQAQIYWNFGTSTAAPTVTSGVPANMTVSDISRGNNNPMPGTNTIINNTSAPAAGTYVGQSAAMNAGLACITGSINTGTNGSGYFEITLTPASGYKVNISAIQFGTRRTGTGPTAFSLRTSINSYASEVGSATQPTATTWELKTMTIGSAIEGADNTPVTLRIYGYNGTGMASTNTTNWRIDDLAVTATAVSTGGPTYNTNSSITYDASSMPASNIAYGSYTGADLTLMNSVELGKFIITDIGADMASTTLTALNLNLAKSANVQRIALYDDANMELAEVAGAASVSFTGLNIVAAENSTKTFSIRANFNTNVTDNDQIIASITSASAAAMGSSFSTGMISASTLATGDINRIEVTADRLAFAANLPLVTNINTPMTPAPQVSATDANGIIDLDFVGSVDITSTGTLNSTPQTSIATAGVASFASIIHTVSGTGLQLTATSMGITNNASSSLFEIGIASNATDYFRTKQSGNWTATNTWESSADQMTWINATLTPTATATGITIGINDTALINANVTVDDLTVNGKIRIINGNKLTIADGTAPIDVNINGTLETSTGSYANDITLTSTARMHVNTGGIIKVKGSGNNVYTQASTVVFHDGAIWEWDNANGTPAFSGQTYFTNLSDPDDVPIMRISTTPNGTAGGGSPTVVNGRLEVNAPFTIGAPSGANAGEKTFKHGIINNATITSTYNGSNIIINGESPILGGTGTINVGNNAVKIGNTVETNLSVTASKTIIGKIALQNLAKVQLNANTLTADSVVNASPDRFIVTTGAGFLKLTNIGTTEMIFPVGYSGEAYTPAFIKNNGTADNYSVRAVNNTLPCMTQYGTNNINIYWDVAEEVSGGSDVSLRLKFGNIISPSLIGTNFTSTNAVIAHCNGSIVDQSGGVLSADTVALGFISNFSPFFITSSPTVLSVKLNSFSVVKEGNNGKLIWNIANDLISNKYVIEKSNTGNNFAAIGTILANGNNNYAYLDNNLLAANYYRLKLIDVNGVVTYSNVLKLMSDKSLYIQQLSPVPVKQQLQVQVASNSSTPVQIALVNMQGQQVYNQRAFLNKGANTLQIQLPTLANGQYIISLSSDLQRITQQIVITQ